MDDTDREEIDELVDYMRSHGIVQLTRTAAGRVTSIVLGPRPEPEAPVVVGDPDKNKPDTARRRSVFVPHLRREKDA